MQLLQFSEIISVNIWQIVISLCNLILLFLIMKKFLYKPVRKVLDQRDEAVRERYGRAEEAEASAEAAREEWQGKLAAADEEARLVMQQATADAEARGREMIDDAHAAAERIVRKAEEDAEAERRKAQSDIRREIVDVSTALSEKMLAREINDDDQRDLIDKFLTEIGEDDDGKE